MKQIEQKLNAILRCLAAEETEEQASARDQIRRIVAGMPLPIRSTEDLIRDLLLELGMPDHLRGHRYLVYALSTVLKDPEKIHSMTHILYPEVAAHFDASCPQVERSIRHAIEICWDRGDLEVLHSYFGNTVSANRGKPTNGEFIARIANALRRQMQQAA